jgi:SAM-dependent methyltransferase
VSARITVETPSLEGLVETGMLQLESLHPGGLTTTRELAAACAIGRGSAVLDVASGTGETACFLADVLGARVSGVDHSEDMVRRAEAKATERGLDIRFEQADAAALPFDDETFDAAICECTLCFLDKPRVLAEMARVVRSGGFVGMHDLCWEDGAPAELSAALADIEGEEPETLQGWRALFDDAGLQRIETVDKSDVKSRWMRDSRKQLGWWGQLALTARIVKRWGLRGAFRVLRSERVFSSTHLGYAIVVGTKP